jgi:hypothetical protein
MARASFQELRQFLPRRQAESVVAALSMSLVAETEHARSDQLDNPESIYRACADMKLSNQKGSAGLLRSMMRTGRRLISGSMSRKSVSPSVSPHITAGITILRAVTASPTLRS